MTRDQGWLLLSGLALLGCEQILGYDDAQLLGAAPSSNEGGGPSVCSAPENVGEASERDPLHIPYVEALIRTDLTSLEPEWSCAPALPLRRREAGSSEASGALRLLATPEGLCALFELDDAELVTSEFFHYDNDTVRLVLEAPGPGLKALELTVGDQELNYAGFSEPFSPPSVYFSQLSRDGGFAFKAKVGRELIEAIFSAPPPVFRLAASFDDVDGEDVETDWVYPASYDPQSKTAETLGYARLER